MIQQTSSTTQALNPVTQRGQDLLQDRQDMFRRVIGTETAPAGTDEELSPKEQARVAAEEFVALSLIQPIFKKMREMNDAAPPFAPGPAEKQFGALMDAEIAQRIVRASGFPVVDQVARNLLQQHTEQPDRRIGAGLEVQG